MMGHTPTPWHVDHHVHIKAENGWRVASVNVPSGSVGSWGVNPSDNAHFIVRAVNCHEELLTAATEAEWFLAHYAEYVASVPVDEIERHPYLPDLQEKVEMLRAAIAKALGRTPNAEDGQ